MSENIKSQFEKVLAITDLDAMIADFKAKLDAFNAANPSTKKDDGKEHDNLKAYLASAEADTSLLELIGKTLNAEEIAKRISEYSIKYVVDHSTGGKKSDEERTVDGMCEYVIKRLTKPSKLQEAKAK